MRINYGYQIPLLPRFKIFLISLLFITTLSNKGAATGGTGTAGEPGPLKISLQDALEFAMENSTAMKTARADLEIAGRRIRETTAAGLPQVDASLGYQFYFDIPTSLVPAEFLGGPPGEFFEIQFGTEQVLNASATISQLVFDGSYIVGLRAARIYRDLARQNVDRSELEIRNRVSETYFLVLLSRDNLSILRNNLANMEQTLDETEKILEAGFTDPINVDQLKLSVSNMKNRITNLERQYELSMNLLKFQIGLDIERQISLTDSLSGLFGKMLKEADITGDFSYQEHIDYKIMLSQHNMNFMNLRREQSFSLPRLTASYTYQEMAMRNDFNFTDMSRPWFPSSYIAVNLSIPVFSSGLRSSRVQQARLELNKSQMATEEVSESLKLQIIEARSQFRTAMERYQTEKGNMELAERILNRTTIMHKEGMASSLELTQANDQMLSTQANYYNAMFEFITAKNNLDKARGL
jgi:outer membrane protein